MPIKSLNLSSLLQKNQNDNTCIRCLEFATDCPFFVVKTKINVSVPSGVINRPKPTDFT